MADMDGRTLGAYKITGKIGQGGMANVYRATQPSIGREVAIKVLPPHFLQDPTFVKRFEREVQVIARLQHPHILPVYDFGEQDGIPYIVMAYMTGGTLTDLIRSEGALPLAEVVRLVEQIASGLDHAHQKGIVHRDFKPSNVLLDENKNVYLADFGIAKVAESSSQITGSGIIGTPAYMAPEATQTNKVTPLVDVYALGVTLFEMLAGHHPYPSETPVGVLLAHAAQPVPDMSQYRADLPQGVQAVIDRAMAKEPSARYQNAGALAADLRAVLGDESPLTEAMPRPVGSGLDGTVRLAPTAPVAAGTPRRNLLIIAGVVAVVAVVAGVFVLGGPGLFSQTGAGATPTSAEAGTPAPDVSPTADGNATILSGHKDAVGSVAFSPDGKTLASGSSDRTVILWDALTGEEKTTLEMPDEVYSMAFYPDGKALAVGGQGGALSFWDVQTGDQLFRQDFLPAGQISVAIAPDQSSYAIASRDVSIAVFEAKSFGWLRAVSYSGPIWSVAYSPDGKTLAAGAGDGSIILKDAQTDADQRTLDGEGGGVKSLAFSPDGKWLASANGSAVTLWDAATGKQTFTMARPKGAVSGPVWSPDGKSLAFGSEDGMIMRWDPATGGVIGTLGGGAGEVGCVAFSPDGKLLAAGMEDGTVILRKLE